jgi:hypothetical protein
MFQVCVFQVFLSLSILIIPAIEYWIYPLSVFNLPLTKICIKEFVFLKSGWLISLRPYGKLHVIQCLLLMDLMILVF